MTVGVDDSKASSSVSLTSNLQDSTFTPVAVQQHKPFCLDGPRSCLGG